MKQIICVGLFCMAFMTSLSGFGAETGSPTEANPSSGETYDFSAVTALIQEWIDKGYYPGAAMRVVKDDRVIYEKCFGTYATTTVVSLVSATKWLEAATVMTLVDEGKINLDAPLSEYLPQFTGDKGRATIRQCLSHTSGLNSMDMPKEEDTFSIADRVSQMVTREMKEKPGEHFHYGGDGLCVAGRVAELVAGKPWEIIFQEKIANPCQMRKTTTGMNMWFLSRHGRPDYIASSSVEDYSHFLEMLSNEGVFRGTRVLSTKAIREMQADQVHDADRMGNDYVAKVRGSHHNGVYGFGEWRELLDDKGNALLLSSPGWYGFYPWIDKRHNLFGVFAGDAENQTASKANFPAFLSSPKLADLVAQAVASGGKVVRNTP